jgi:hypothetical protein
MSSTSSDGDGRNSSLVGSEAFDGVVPLYMKQLDDEPQHQRPMLSTNGKLPVNQFGQVAPLSLQSQLNATSGQFHNPSMVSIDMSMTNRSGMHGMASMSSTLRKPSLLDVESRLRSPEFRRPFESMQTTSRSGMHDQSFEFATRKRKYSVVSTIA